MEEKATVDKITNLQELIEASKKLTEDDNFSYNCNSREFEESFILIANNVAITEAFEEEITDYINKNYTNSKLNPLCYVLFLILFTIKRKVKTGDLENYFNAYGEKFRQYKFTRFIELLTDYNVYKDDEHLKVLLISAKKLTDPIISKSDKDYDFSSHAGILNFYTEVVCTYYEQNLDERSTEKAKEHLDDAYSKINRAITECAVSKNYPKFYLNKGRLEILRCNYSDGERLIKQAIKYLPSGTNRLNSVIEYEHFLTKIEMIRLYDINTNKIKEVEKIKTDNLKSLSLMTALLGFLLGAINIFTNVNDIKVMALLMLTYACLILTVLGVLLFGIKLLYKEKNSKFTWFTLILFILGVAGFSISVLLIL